MNECPHINQWKSTTGLDSNSQYLQPYIISDNDLHLNSNVVSGMGFYIPELAYDFDGDVRVNPQHRELSNLLLFTQILTRSIIRKQ